MMHPVLLLHNNTAGFTTMRMLALFTGVLTAFTLVKPFANFIATVRGIAAPSSMLTLMTIGGMAFASALAGVVLLFFFALYRDRGTLHVSRRMQLLGRLAALLLGIILAVDGTAGMWNAISYLTERRTSTQKIRATDLPATRHPRIAPA